MKIWYSGLHLALVTWYYPNLSKNGSRLKKSVKKIEFCFWAKLVNFQHFQLFEKMLDFERLQYPNHLTHRKLGSLCLQKVVKYLSHKAHSKLLSDVVIHIGSNSNHLQLEHTCCLIRRHTIQQLSFGNCLKLRSQDTNYDLGWIYFALCVSTSHSILFIYITHLSLLYKCCISIFDDGTWNGFIAGRALNKSEQVF